MRQAPCSLEVGVSDEASLVECHFLVPLVRDTDRRPHSPTAWRMLQDALRRRFGGRSGPEQMYVSMRAVPGEYTSESGARVQDRSYRYVVALETGRLEELCQLLRCVANTFDQEAIYLSVKGDVTFVRPRPEDGALSDE
jgi:hypothetical protein